MAAESLGKLFKIMIHKPQTRLLGGQDNSLLKQTKTQVILMQSCLGLEAM